MPLFQPDTANGPEIAGLEEYLKYFILERVSEVESKLLQDDPEYRRIRERFERFLQDLTQLLPELGSETILEAIRETAGMLVVTGGRCFFSQGFRDGAGFIKMLGK
jgi:dGTP triphosphohydrolase